MLEAQLSNKISTADFDGSWNELRSRPEYIRIAELADTQSTFALAVDSTVEAISTLLLLVDRPHLNLLILLRNKLTEGVVNKIIEAGFNIFDASGTELHKSKQQAIFAQGTITLLTSGSTGVPKLIQHTFETLFTAKRTRRAQARQWLVPYQTGSYAWFQLVTQGLFVPEQNLVFTSEKDFQKLFLLAAEKQVDCISATPTFWRMALLTVPSALLRSVPLQLITFGGELVDQAILDQVIDLYPAAEIIHIYASTEVGACIVVKDKMAGFPVSILNCERDGAPSIRMYENKLQVMSPFAGKQIRGEKGGKGEWIDTGDLVEVRGDRVFFCGRADTAMINVGGNKAFPADIEAVIQSCPGIAWCRVRAVRAPLVGHLPEADVVLQQRKHVSETALVKFCSEVLPEYAVPRFWNFLNDIPMESSMKSTL